MILRIFATDGFTPESIFRWSVEQTAAHLCDQQVLWVTRLDGPWQKLVSWFLKQPCCRAVVLDSADRWEWNLEHEVTWKVAQGLYFQQEPQAVCWLHDDMAPPDCWMFKQWLREWLTSKSTTVESPCYQLWDSFSLIRADKVGIDLAADSHCWIAKWSDRLKWLLSKGQSYGLTDAPDRFKPLGSIEPWISPWPFRHAKGVDRAFREHTGFARRGSTVDLWRTAGTVKCLQYDPEVTWTEFRAKAELL